MDLRTWLGRRLVGVGVAGSLLATVALVACTGGSGRAALGALPSALLTPKATATLPDPSPAPVPTGPKLPSVRWDLVPRGRLPATCTTHGVTTAHVGTPSQAYATGPSLSCSPGQAYWVRALVKLATGDGHGHWRYLTPVRPSDPVVGQAAAQVSPPIACTKGELLLPVASFVLTWPDGHQVRYKRTGSVLRCR